MTLELWVGVAAVFLAGLLQGLYAVPMKITPRWNYENIWPHSAWPHRGTSVATGQGYHPSRGRTIFTKTYLRAGLVLLAALIALAAAQRQST